MPWWKRPLFAGFVCVAVAFGCNKATTRPEMDTSPQKTVPKVKKGGKDFQMPQPGSGPLPPPQPK
jgi:hypothetical protein